MAQTGGCDLENGSVHVISGCAEEGRSGLPQCDLLFYLEVINSSARVFPFLGASSRRASCLTGAKQTNVSLTMRHVTLVGAEGSVLLLQPTQTLSGDMFQVYNKTEQQRKSLRHLCCC